MNRIDQTFERCQSEGRKALITFTMAGDPDAATSVSILEELAKHADILEIGMPFTDPMADGPAIQAAGIRALQGGMSLSGVLKIVQQFRSKNFDAPIVLMGYFNPILQYGIEKFSNDCSMLGVDGLIVVDIPPEEADEIAPILQHKNIALIRLLTPTTDANRLPKILEGASGFLYYVSIAGVTGTASADPAKVGAHIRQIRASTTLPIVAGFGIRTAEDVRAMAGFADGVVVGSALVQTIAEASKETRLKDLATQVEGLAKALKAA